MSRITSSILNHPNPFLTQKCKQIIFPLSQQTLTNISLLKQSFRDSFVTHQIATLGLAAPQIGILQRFFIMPKSLNYPHNNWNLLKTTIRNFNVYINPIILPNTNQNNKIKIIQNCLSMGKEYYEVEREEKIKVHYYNVKGDKIQEEMTGIKARVFLHQNDHLDGVLMHQRGNKITQEQINKIKVQQLRSSINQHQTFK